MSRSPLIVRRLGIRKMPGFRKAGSGFVLDGLSPHITIVYGPNGSGKTTTAKAIQALMWPEVGREGAYSVEGDLGLGGHDWRMDVDSGRSLCQRDGQPADIPVPPADVRDRYYLALHELLLADGRRFAETIERESAGGYSLPLARKALGFAPVIPKSGKVSKALAESRRALREAQSHQLQIAREAEELGEMELRLEEVRAAGQRADLLSLAVDYRKAAEDAARALEAFRAFPESLGMMSGVEVDDYARLSAEIETIDEQLLDGERQGADAQDRVRGCALPDGGIPSRVTDDVAERIGQLDRLDVRIQALGTSLAAAEARRSAEADIFGRREQRYSGPVDLSAIEQIESVLSQRGTVSAEQQACLAVKDWLGKIGDDEGGEPRPDSGVMDEGLRLLVRWLDATWDEPRATAVARWGTVVAGSMLMAAGAMAAYAIAPVWCLLIPVGLTAVILALRPRAASRRGAEWIRLYRETGCPLPRSWTADDVSRALMLLLSKRADAQLKESRRDLWRNSYSARTARIETEQRKLDARREELIRDLGVDPGMGDGSVLWFVRAMQRWHAADVEVKAARAELGELAVARTKVLDSIRMILQPYDVSSAEDVSSVKAAIQDITRRQAALEAARADLLRIQANAERLRVRRHSLDAERDAIFERLALAAGDVAALRHLCDMREGHRAAMTHVTMTKTAAGIAESRLRAHDGFEASLLVKPVEACEHGRSEAQSLADTEDSLRSEIVRMRERITAGRRSHDVESAIAAYERARDALLAKRDDDYAASIGCILADTVERRHAEGARPRVFERARGLLLQMTNGRCRLDMSEGDGGFRAFDTVDGEGRSLDELSSGTRVQLLLAVRLAFVETCEIGAMLPLIVDEVLANSDDPRAEAVIKAITQVARSGRQVFYFTAQRDEVAKWQHALDGTDVEYRTVDLVGVRGLAGVGGAIPQRPPVPLRAETPRSGGLGHAEYGSRLAVPPIDPRLGVDALHPWFLIRSTDVLHRVIDAGAVQWGQVEAFLEFGGEKAFGECDLRATRALGRAAGVMCAAWGVGRGKPVDVEAMEGSGVVTSAFRDRLYASLAESKGDASRLMELVAELPRFGTKRVGDLRQWLEDEGYLDSRPQLPREAVRTRMMASVSGELAQGLVGSEDVERLLDGLASGWSS